MRGVGEGGGVNTEHALDWLSGWSPPYKESIFQIPGSIEGPIHLLKTGDNIMDFFFGVHGGKYAASEFTGSVPAYRTVKNPMIVR